MATPGSDLATRMVAGAAMAGTAVGALWLGGLAFWALCCLVALGVLREWSLLMRADTLTRTALLMALAIPLGAMAWDGPAHGLWAAAFLGGATLVMLAVTRRPWLAAGLIYAGLPVLALVEMRGRERGVEFALWAMALVWLCDIGAYFAGRWLGGPRLAPEISPNKTWAGLAGGVAAAALLGVALHLGWGLPWRLTLATPVLALISQGGDLFESWLKRRAGVKDSGGLLPGHGGLLDRLDGLVPVAPMAAALAMLPQIQGLLG